jgi:hypothetical protein
VKGLCAVLVGAALLWGVGEARSAPVRAPAEVSKMPNNWRIWIAMGRCEQPGRGAWGINWSHRGPTYQGGLGMFHATWDGWRPRHYPGNAGDASWRQQMNVANRVARDVGFSAWSCWGRIR